MVFFCFSNRAGLGGGVLGFFSNMIALNAFTGERILICVKIIYYTACKNMLVECNCSKSQTTVCNTILPQTGACFSQLKPNVGESTNTNSNIFGAAFVCLTVATIFKVLDVAAHLIVPVPKVDYWKGKSSEDESEKSGKGQESNGKSDVLIVETTNVIHSQAV